MQGTWQVDSHTITQGGAVAFLLIASGSLLLLYFFLDKAFFVLLVSWHIYTVWHHVSIKWISAGTAGMTSVYAHACIQPLQPVCGCASACNLHLTVHELLCLHSRRHQKECAYAKLAVSHVGMQIVLFSMGGVQALAAALTPLCAWVLPHQTIHPPFGEVFVHAVLSLGLSIATAAVWLIFRSSSWAWALQDLLGMSLIIMVLRQFRLPNIKVRIILLLSDWQCVKAVCLHICFALWHPKHISKLCMQHLWTQSCDCLCML